MKENNIGRSGGRRRRWWWEGRQGEGGGGGGGRGGEEQGVMRLQKGLIPQLIGGAVAVEVRPSQDYH